MVIGVIQWLPLQLSIGHLIDNATHGLMIQQLANIVYALDIGKKGHLDHSKHLIK